jgi:hypothetical protein
MARGSFYQGEPTIYEVVDDGGTVSTDPSEPTVQSSFYGNGPQLDSFEAPGQYADEAAASAAAAAASAEAAAASALEAAAAAGGTAADVDFTPAGNLASTDVQAALEELDAEKAPLSHTHAIADVTGLQAELDLKAALASPTFTGTPAAPTAAPGTNTTQLATTAFVFAAGALKADLASPTFTGTPAAPTAAPGTNTTQLATTAFVAALGALKADLASPTFTGVPAAPTASLGTNTTQLATTAFVLANAASTAIVRKDGVIAPNENLVLKRTSATQVQLTATAILTFDVSTGSSYRATSISETSTITTAGAGGLDTGAEANSTWYHVWLATDNAASRTLLLSTSTSAPTLPGGYTHRAYVGAVYNNSAGNFEKFVQFGNRVYSDWQWVSQPVVSNQTQANYTAASLTSSVPSTATSVVLQPGTSTSGATVAGSVFMSADGSGTTATTDDNFYTRTCYSGEAKQYVPGVVVPLTTAQQFMYRTTGANVSATIYVIGWIYG